METLVLHPALLLLLALLPFLVTWWLLVRGEPARVAAVARLSCTQPAALVAPLMLLVAVAFAPPWAAPSVPGPSPPPLHLASMPLLGEGSTASATTGATLESTLLGHVE